MANGELLYTMGDGGHTLMFINEFTFDLLILLQIILLVAYLSPVLTTDS